MGLINFDRRALSGQVIILESSAPQADVVMTVIRAAQTKPPRFSKRWGYGCRVLDPSEWAQEVGREVGLDPEQVLAVVSHRPDLEHEIAVLNIEGLTGLAFFVEGLPDMKVVSFGRGQAKGVAKVAAADLVAAGYPTTVS